MSPTTSLLRSTPRNIICIGRNYVDHALELGNKVPKEPFYFLKPTSSYLLHPSASAAGGGNGGNGDVEVGKRIEIPRGVEVHHEVELGVIIGKKGREIDPKRAMEYVAGYTLAIDVTGRNMQNAVKAKGLPWSAAKGFDSWCPVGPFIPKSTLPEISKVGLYLKINNEFKQRGVAGDMIFDVEKLIGFVSGVFTLNEGDLILTGTPAGVGRMNIGDKVEVGLTYPGLEGEEVSKLDWECVAREGGYEFKA